MLSAIFLALQLATHVLATCPPEAPNPCTSDDEAKAACQTYGNGVTIDGHCKNGCIYCVYDSDDSCKIECKNSIPPGSPMTVLTYCQNGMDGCYCSFACNGDPKCLAEAPSGQSPDYCNN